jgi:hypothetical protein
VWVYYNSTLYILYYIKLTGRHIPEGTFFIFTAVKPSNPTYKNIILPVVLYGCETWFVTLREEHRRRVFDNRVLKRMFGPKRDEVTGGCMKLHSEEFHDFNTLSQL